MNEPMTMADVAKLAKVSQSTVSRVLNGDPVVAEATATRVRQLAQQAGYKLRTPRKERLASEASVQRVAVIARTILDGSLSTMLSGAMSQISSAGFMPVFMQHSELCEESLVDLAGAIIIRWPENPVYARLLQDVPCVQVLGMPTDCPPAIDLVTYDYQMVGTLAAEWLYRKGCRRLVAVMPGDNAVAEARLGAFQRRAAELGCSVSIIHTASHTIYSADAQKAAASMQTMNPSPDGLFAFNDHALLSLYGYLIKAGFDLEADLQLIGCDAEPFIGALSPQLATIDVHLGQLAKRAVETLTWRLKNPDDQPVSLMLRPELVEPAQAEAKHRDLVTVSMT